MGAVRFIEFNTGKTAEEAFEDLVIQAEYDYGHNPYNGTISTTRLIEGCEKVADVWSKEAKQAAYEAVEADGYGDKWESRALDCGRFADTDMRMWAFYGWASC